jgi:hypothetical protein
MQRNNIILECIDVVHLTKAYFSSFQISLTQQNLPKNTHDIYFFRTCEAICEKMRMDKFHVCVLIVEVSLDESMNGFVCDSFSAGMGKIVFNTRHKMSLLLGRWQKKGNCLLK